jgi:hypothetical protein
LKQSQFDECLFYAQLRDGSQLLVLTHVDDMLCVGLERHLQQVRAHLQRRFQQITAQLDEPEMSYLGLTIRRDRAKGELSLSQVKHVDGVCNDLGISSDPIVPTPYDSKVFEIDEQSQLIDAGRAKVFKSVAASLQWLVCTRPDIRLITHFLLTRPRPTEQDWDKLLRVGRYLKGTRDLPLIMRKSTIVLRGSADASHACHPNDRYVGHTGGAIWIGETGAPVATFCTKQKLTAHSSMEAELIALDTVVLTGLWLLAILKEVGILDHDAYFECEQDNQTAISSLMGNEAPSGVHRAVNIKYYWMRDRVKENALSLTWVSTDRIIANGFTKGLTRSQYSEWSRRILNHVSES